MRARSALVAGLACAGCGAAAQPCATPASAVPLRGHLRAVLAELAGARHFTVVAWTRDDPLVSLDAVDDIALVQSLSGQANLIATYAARAGCPGEWRIDTVWILPQGRAAPLPPVARPAPRPPDAATQAFLRAHGAARPASQAASAAD